MSSRTIIGVAAAAAFKHRKCDDKSFTFEPKQDIVPTPKPAPTLSLPPAPRGFEWVKWTSDQAKGPDIFSYKHIYVPGVASNSYCRLASYNAGISQGSTQLELGQAGSAYFNTDPAKHSGMLCCVNDNNNALCEWADMEMLTQTEARAGFKLVSGVTSRDLVPLNAVHTGYDIAGNPTYICITLKADKSPSFLGSLKFTVDGSKGQCRATDSAKITVTEEYLVMVSTWDDAPTPRGFEWKLVRGIANMTTSDSLPPATGPDLRLPEGIVKVYMQKGACVRTALWKFLWVVHLVCIT
jgi:hypothetical protein